MLACHWGAGQEQQFQRAARLGDGFISISDRPDEFTQVANKVRGYAGEFGKHYESMEAAFYLTVNLGLDETASQEEAERYLTMYYGANIWGDRWGPFGVPSARSSVSKNTHGPERGHLSFVSLLLTRIGNWTPS